MNRKCVRILQEALLGGGVYKLPVSPEKTADEDAVYSLLQDGFMRETTIPTLQQTSGSAQKPSFLQFTLTPKGWAAADWRRAG